MNDSNQNKEFVKRKPPILWVGWLGVGDRGNIHIWGFMIAAFC